MEPAIHCQSIEIPSVSEEHRVAAHEHSNSLRDLVDDECPQVSCTARRTDETSIKVDKDMPAENVRGRGTQYLLKLQ